MSTTNPERPAARRITESDRPVFPCWLWYGNYHMAICGWYYRREINHPEHLDWFTFWSPDSKTPPKTRPIVRYEDPDAPIAPTERPDAFGYSPACEPPKHPYPASVAAPDWAREAAREIADRIGHIQSDVFAAIILRHAPAAQGREEARELQINPALAELLVDALYECDNVCIIGDGCRSEDRDKFLIRQCIFTTLGLPMPTLKDFLGRAKG